MNRAERAWRDYQEGKITLEEYLRVFREELDRAARRRERLSHYQLQHARDERKAEAVAQ